MNEFLYNYSFIDYRNIVLRLLLVGIFVCSLVKINYGQERRHAKKPNIILILADDLGWNDVGFHGGVPKTPNIDRLAEQSLELSRFYVAPICTPTRAGLMTGRYPIRFGMMRAVIPPWRIYGLPTEEETLPEMLKRGGYANRAVLGKWHLGHADPKYHPLNQGFTYFYGAYNGALDYFTHKREGELDWHRDFMPNYDKGYITELLTNEAVAYINRHKKNSSPFFLYLPYTAPHAPQQVPGEYLEMYPNLEGEQKVHAAMVSALDDGVGKIMEALRASNLKKETLLFFMSDNGGAKRFGASNAPLRGEKQEVFEGGVRAIAMVRWPGQITPGKTTFAMPMSMVDIFPTLQSIAGISKREGKPLDGIDLADVFHGDHSKIDRVLYNYWGQQKNLERLAIWENEWKLIYNGPDIHRVNPENQSSLYLFNLKEDSKETENMIDRYPQKVRSMLQKLKEFRQLQPQNGLPVYGKGRRGFTAPENWNIYLFDHDKE